MTKRMLIDAAHAGETRVAIIENDRIYDYDFVTTSKNQLKGNIYLAKITRVEPSLQAAFVEYGNGKQGFLPFAEIHPDYYQLPQDDKLKLLEEQIAEAEAEEAAEDEAFEREQAAREARKRGGDRDQADGDEEHADDHEAEAEMPALANEAHAEPADYHVSEPLEPVSLPEVPALEIPQPELSDEPATSYSVEPLQAESFAVSSDVLEEAPAEEPTPAEAANLEDAGAEPARAETTSEDSEETRGRRPSRSAHRRYRIQEVIKRNQIVLVQVIKEERGNKGASLTTYISLAGRCAVLMPNSPKGGGISRKITDRETRKRLKEVASEMRTHRGMSVIIRTAGIDRTKAEIRRDYEYLVKLWNQVREGTLAATAPALIYEEGNLIKRSLRDQYTSDVAEVIVEGESAFHEAKDFMKMLMPSHAARVKLYKDPVPLFSYAGVEDQLASMMDPQVKLPSGGYVVIHATEALIAIDVNSGRSTTERNVEETAVKTNIEAAVEAARQLRLRDLAGLIVIDFIDMNYGKNRKAVERALKDALKHDRAKIQMGRISMFGLLELSRQRMRPSLSEAMGVHCPHCRGTGYIHSVDTVAIQIIRTLEKEAASGEYATLRVTTHPEAALHLLNEKRALLQSLEQRYKVNVVVLMDNAIITGNYRLIKVNLEGREVAHEDGKQGGNRERRRGRRGGGRGGRNERGNPISFEGAVEASVDDYVPEESEFEDDDEVIGSSEGITEGEVREVREPRRERGERGGRRRGGRNRNRDRGERPDRANRSPEEIAASANGAEGEEAPQSFDENGEPRPDRGDRNGRRRGRRGGRNRRGRGERGERDGAPQLHEASPGGLDVPGMVDHRASDSTQQAPAQASPAPAPRSASVVPISEAQTNPSAAGPIISESGDSDKPKRKGWFSRVMEN